MTVDREGERERGRGREKMTAISMHETLDVHPTEQVLSMREGKSERKK